MLRGSPAFTVLVVAMLALGIGANTAMFSILDAWLIEPLHFPDPQRLAIVLKSEAPSAMRIPISGVGARAGDLVRMAVAEGVRLELGGITIGILGALALARIIPACSME